jgi:hypothetical protein
MDEKSRADLTKQVPIRDLKMEPEAEELLESEAMQPYMNLEPRMNAKARKCLIRVYSRLMSFRASSFSISSSSIFGRNGFCRKPTCRSRALGRVDT